MSRSSHRRASTYGVRSLLGWISHSSVEITPQPPSAFTSRMAACASGIAWPMPLQCGTWKKRFFVVTGPMWTGSNRMS